MQFDIKDTSAVSLLATNLARRAQYLEKEKAFVQASLDRLAQSFQDEGYLNIKLSFGRMNRHIEEVIPEIKNLCERLCDVYDALLAAQNAMNN